MRGKISLQISKRTGNLNTTWYHDKWNKNPDKIILQNIIGSNKLKYFKVISVKRGFQTFMISRDELAFIKVIFFNYKEGDYCIRMWAKGKGRGYRTFWDGLITKDGKFFRRKDSGIKFVMGTSSDMFERSTMSKYPEQQIGKYMRTKQPGVWHII